jgi:hypothetical protein
LIAAYALALLGGIAAAPEPALAWASPNRHRVLLRVDPRRRPRTRSVATVALDLAAELAARGGRGAVDPDSIEVVAYDATGRPRVFDDSRPGDERYLLPWRIERSYPTERVTLHFVLPDAASTRYAVYFDAAGSGRGRPDRYPGLVGDGDLFRHGRGRREVAASANDTFADIDGDGDLDLLEGGVEPFVRVFENAGGGRFVSRGPITSRGEVLVFPRDPGNRSWLSVEAADWDGDGDQDLFVFFLSGPFINQVVRYENVTARGEGLAFEPRGPLLTRSGRVVAGRVAFVDWDGDGRLDVMCSSPEGLLAFHRNEGASRAVAEMTLADGIPLQANGVVLQVDNPRPDFADIDADGDLDLFAGTEDGPVLFFENVGRRAEPVLGVGRILVHHGYMDAKTGVKVADFDGDGLLDLVVGRFWERSTLGPQPPVHGRLFKNVGTASAPRFEARDASGGAPFTEGFQPLDAVRQNSVRAVDWDNDGRLDLIAGDTDGYVWLFRHLGGGEAPLFAAGERLQAGGAPLKVYGEEPEKRAAGYARPDVADWNADGRKDLLVADGRGWLTLYLNQGTDAAPVLARGRRLSANGHPIDGTSRGSVHVTDFNRDGRKDVLFGMVGEGPSRDNDWPPQNKDRTRDRGILYYPNVGTDAAPVLGPPRWVRLGVEGAAGGILRPNLGDFADWDGDGARDLIVCEFENLCRVFRNTTGGAPGRKPLFAAAPGLKVLAPWTAQMISGADAVDWNGDRDLDLLTGQGHGGSGLRFFERDYIDDVLNGTLPVVTVERE